MADARALVASYLLEPDRDHPANAWLYVCRDRDYSVDKLAPAVRRNVRRGSRELRIEPVTTDCLLANGFQAFSDTRGRVGVSDGTREVFTRRFEARGKCRGHVFLGAWHDQDLVAFLSITAVDDWAEIEGCFSSNAALGLRPNDTLMVGGADGLSRDQTVHARELRPELDSGGQQRRGSARIQDEDWLRGQTGASGVRHASALPAVGQQRHATGRQRDAGAHARATGC